MSSKIQGMHEALEAFQKKTQEKLKAALPVGTLLEVNISHGTWIEFEVTGYSCTWYYPLEVQGINIHTGKRRRFTAGSKTYPFKILAFPENRKVYEERFGRGDYAVVTP